jgi:AcrR family transcriptional regulator
MDSNLPKSADARPTQRRGDARREQLLQAAQTLLETRDFGEVTFVAVCEQAGIPHGSARYFYPDLPALLRGLLGELGKRHDEHMARHIRGKAAKSWRALVHCLIDRSAEFQRGNPVFAKLTISGYMPPELKRLDRDADLNRARFLLAKLDEFFVLPRHKDNERVAYYAIEIVDTGFMLSVRECGRITAWWVRQGKRCAELALEAHFGDLKPRQVGRRIARSNLDRGHRPASKS